MPKTITNVIGFDDGPFLRSHRGAVRIVGAVCARTRLDGVVSGFVSRDGSNSTARVIELIQRSQFARSVRAVLLQGVAFAGFNVVDVVALYETLDVPVLVVMRRLPRLAPMRAAIFAHTRGAARRWNLIQRAGEVERLGSICVQRIGIDRDATAALLRATTLQGNLPEPLRLAHLIAGGITTGASRGRA